jgi:hypothetical protein
LGPIRLPALECSACHVIVLTETLARSEAERVAIRQAMDARQAIVQGAVPSGVTDAETVPLMPTAHPVPDESGKFPAGAEVPTESRIRKVSKEG